MEPLAVTERAALRPPWLVGLLKVSGIVFLANYAAALLTLFWQWIGLYGVPGSVRLDLSDGLIAGVPWFAVGLVGGWLAVRTANPERGKTLVLALAILIAAQHLISGGIWRLTADSVDVFTAGAAFLGATGALVGGYLTHRRTSRQQSPGVDRSS